MKPEPLTGQDYSALSSRWIDLVTAEQAGIHRISHFDGKEITGNSAKDLAGLWIPYYEPGNGNIIGGRIRRDHPEVKVTPDGKQKPQNKYINAPGFRHIYVPPGITKTDLANTALPVIIAEGEFKALAALRLARHNSAHLRFLPIAVGGAYNWQGKIGKIETADGTMVDEKGLLPDFHLLEWSTRKVILAFDQDQDSRINRQVKSQRFQLRQHLLAMGATVADLEWPLTVVRKATYGGEPLHGGPQPLTAKGLDDWLHRDGPEVVLKAIDAVEYRDSSHWQSKLKTFPTTGQPKALVLNALIALEESPDMAGALEFDIFSHQLTCNRRPWSEDRGPWESTDSVRLAAWLQSHGIEVGIDTAKFAARTAARQRDPLADYIRALEWDGVPRIDGFFIDYMNIKTTNPESVDITNYVCAVSRAWMVGGIARALEPGCQMDYVPVFVGVEGYRKSTALQILANGWFTDSISDIHGDEAMRKLQGVWIVEFGEIEAWKRAEATALRDFISRKDDKYRKLYEDNVQSHLRRCVFTGTVNPDEKDFLNQDSKNRRYWPLTCTRIIDTERIKADRHQLWAEAKFYWEEGAKPYLRDEQLEEMAGLVREGHRKIEHPWTEKIMNWLDQREAHGDNDDGFGMLDVLAALNVDISKLTGGRESAQVAAILTRLGYESRQCGKKRLRRWRKVEE